MTTSAMTGKLYNKLGVPNAFDAGASFVTSPFFSTTILASIRLTLAFYTLFTLIFVLVWDAVREDSANSFFSYFTELSYIGLCAYFFASGVQTLVYAASKGKSYPLERWPRFLQFLHVLLFSTISTFPFVVTIVFWGALFPDKEFTDKFDVWSNVSMHALNSVFALFEILFTHAGPMPWTHIPLIILLLACYLGVAYITHATQGFYTYSFLDPSQQGAKLAGWITGIAIAGILIFTLARTLCVFREKLVQRFGLENLDVQTTTATAGRTTGHTEQLDEWVSVDLEEVGMRRQGKGTSLEVSSPTSTEEEKGGKRARP